MKILQFLHGKKTYILVAAGLVVAGLHFGGVMDTESTNTALAALGLGSIATLRSAIKDLLAKATAGADSAPPPPAPPAA